MFHVYLVDTTTRQVHYHNMYLTFALAKAAYDAIEPDFLEFEAVLKRPTGTFIAKIVPALPPEGPLLIVSR